MAHKTLVRPNNPAKAREYFEHKMTFTTGPVETNRLIEQREDVVIVDVRAREDYEQGHLPGAISLPEGQWQNPQGLSKDKQNILYCYSHVCHLAAKAAVELAGQGFPVMEMDGGFKSWRKHDLPIEK